MKNFKKTILSLMMMTIVTLAATAQDATTAELKVATSAICGSCKATIEKALAFEKGVKKSELDVKTKVVTVTYNPEKTSPEKIRLAISNAGYDADDVKANPKAYKKLDDCCKKENAPKQ
jgi:mercuric ion binding protein